MNSSKPSFRNWWKGPRRLLDRERDRRVTFLELFYDLVYVVLIAELGHALSQDITLKGIGGFVFLFVIVWWAWINGTMYHDLHGQNDTRTRIFTFIQMFCVAAMAVFAHNALGAGYIGFALSYAAFQLTLTFLWWRTGMHDPLHRPLSQPYSLAFLISSLLIAGSVFAPSPWTFYLWGLSLIISMLIPFYTRSLGKNRPEVQEQIDRSFSLNPSTVERFGLFTIIVLGEVIVGVVQGVAGHSNLNWLTGATAALGMMIAVEIWWIYFDFISHRPPIQKNTIVSNWIFLHLPMTLCIAAGGASVLTVIEHSGKHLPVEVNWLLVGSLALALASVALLMRIIQIPKKYKKFYLRGSMVTLFCGFFIVLLGLFKLDILLLLVLMNLFMFAPIFYGFKVWVKTFKAEEIQLE